MPPENPTLTIPFAEPSVEGADLVLLEQEPEGEYAGLLTKIGMTRYLDWHIYATGGSPPRVMRCGPESGFINTAVLVWPLTEDVRYQLFATIGRLGAGQLAEVEEEDTASFTLTKTASLKHPARRVLSAVWLTGPWTFGGERVEPPPLFVAGRELRTNVTVYGSVRIRYAARRYRHALSIPWSAAKPLLAADNWSEWAVCLPPPGRPVALSLSVGRGATDMAERDSSCGRGRSRFSVTGPEPEWPPIAEPEDKRVNCEYCTGECEEEDAD